LKLFEEKIGSCRERKSRETSLGLWRSQKILYKCDTLFGVRIFN